MAQTLVTMEANGRLVIPAALRTELGIVDREMLAVENRDGSIVLTPVVVVPVDHTFPSTPDLVAAAARAKAEPGQTMSRADVIARMKQATRQDQTE